MHGIGAHHGELGSGLGQGCIDQDGESTGINGDFGSAVVGYDFAFRFILGDKGRCVKHTVKGSGSELTQGFFVREFAGDG